VTGATPTAGTIVDARNVDRPVGALYDWACVWKLGVAHKCISASVDELHSGTRDRRTKASGWRSRVQVNTAIHSALLLLSCSV
jgi:hypothetical protein